MLKMQTKLKGFTLIEILIAIILIAILCSVAAASYRSYIVKSRRQALNERLMDLQQKVEDFYLINHTYVGACDSDKGADCNGQSDVSKFYKITFDTNFSGNDSYMLKAVTIGQQNSDTECKYIYLRRNGERGGGTALDSSTTNACW